MEKLTQLQFKIQPCFNFTHTATLTQNFLLRIPMIKLNMKSYHEYNQINQDWLVLLQFTHKVELNLMKLFYFMLTLSLFHFGIHSQSEECQNFVKQLIENIVKLNISSIPLPSIMYSGITTNNPGQFYECEQLPNYSYYLVTIKNTTTNINTFTGICVPKKCSPEDMKIALDFWNCQVYDFPEQQTDALAVIGIVVLSLWLAILIVWSIVLSCKEPEVNQYAKKDKQQMVPVNQLSDNRQSQQSLNNDPTKSEFMNSNIFNYYEGYCKIFKKQKRKSIIGSFLFLAGLSVLISVEFSFKQSISSNPSKSYDFFDSFLGIFVTNTQLAFSMIMFIFGMKLAYGVYKLTTFQEIGRYFFDQLLKKWVFFFIISLSIYGVMSFTDKPLSKYWMVNFGQDCPNYMWQQWFLFRHFQLDGRVCLPWLWIPQAQMFLTLLAAPFIIIFRIKKNLGYALMGLVCLISMIISFAILSDQGVIFEPTKIFNQQKEYSVNYQTNTFVRAGSFYFGLLFAFMIIEGLEKVEGKNRTGEYRLAKKVRKSKMVQNLLHGFGIVIMIVVLSMVALYFDRDNRVTNKSSAYWFLTLSPTAFLIGFSMFVLPSFWQVEAGLSYYINKIFGWSGWNSLEKLTPVLLPIGPAVMGFTTFSTQNNIYFDLQTITVYLLGDLLMVYIVSLLVCAAIQNQIVFIFNYMQHKVYGKENKYSILLLEE